MFSLTSIDNQNSGLYQIIELIKKEEMLSASQMLDAIVDRGSDDISLEYGATLAKALREGTWEEVGELFVEGAAISKTGKIFHVAPFCNRQGVTSDYLLTAIWGEVLRLDMPAAIQGIVDSDPQGRDFKDFYGHVPPQIVPMRVFAGSGHAQDNTGKTFFPPEFWKLPDAHKGPALLNVSLLRERTLGPAGTHIKKITTPETSRLLLQAHGQTQELSEALFAFEYQLHEAGHSYGIGINNLIERKWLQNNSIRTIEEWRTDGFEYHYRDFGNYRYITNTKEPKEFQVLRDAGQIGDHTIAANLLLRFGIIGIRPNPEDADLGTSLLTFDRLLRAGDLIVTSRNQLHIPDAEHGCFPKTFGKELGKESEQLTRQLLQAQSFDEYEAVVNQVTVPNDSKELFFNIVRPI